LNQAILGAELRCCAGLFMTVPHQSAGYIELLFSSSDCAFQIVADSLQLEANTRRFPGHQSP